MGPQLPHFAVSDDKERVTIELSSGIYPLSVVFSTAYSMLSEAFILLDGDPQSTILVYIQSKTATPAEKLARDFIDRLLTFGLAFEQEKRFKADREEILKRALLTHTGD